MVRPIFVKTSHLGKTFYINGAMPEILSTHQPSNERRSSNTGDIRYYLVHDRILISWLLKKSPNVTGKDVIPYILCKFHRGPQLVTAIYLHHLPFPSCHPLLASFPLPLTWPGPLLPQENTFFSQTHSYTLPEANREFTLKMGGWETTFLFRKAYFQRLCWFFKEGNTCKDRNWLVAIWRCTGTAYLW